MFVHYRNPEEKEEVLEAWREWSSAACLVLGYDAFKSLVYNKSKKIRNHAYECLLRQGAVDLVICDEGHMIKNQNTAITSALNEIEVSRRIILTGTPVQNNLNECKLKCTATGRGSFPFYRFLHFYISTDYSMVNFVKPFFFWVPRKNSITCSRFQ